MRFEQFRDGQWGISNDWAIKITKDGKKYKFSVVDEEDCIIDNVQFWDDAVINMDLEKFIAMHTNNNFVEFINKGWSVLKASDTTPEVLDNICSNTGRTHVCGKREINKLLSCYELWEPRYMWYDQIRNFGEVDYIKSVLDDEDIDEENTNWE